MFVRTKNIKGSKYAYLVKNKWHKRKSRPIQKVQKYLGKVYSLTTKNNTIFQDYIPMTIDSYVKNSTPQKKNAAREHVALLY